MTTEFYPLPRFPASEALDWVPPQQLTLTDTQADWLLYEGSLTARLKRIGKQFSVQLLGQAQHPPHAEERRRVAHERPVVVREVLLYCNHQPWVFARSLFSPRAENANTLNLKTLGEQSLGESLFGRDDLHSGSIEVADVQPNHPVAEWNTRWFHSTRHLLGRRRMFSTQGEQLLVSEVFLEPSPLYSRSTPEE